MSRGKIDRSLCLRCGFAMIIRTASPAVLYLAKKDWRLARVIGAIGDIECREYPDAFAFIAREIVEQMLSVKAADRIRARVAELAGGEYTPERLLGLTTEELRAAGMSRNKAGYLLDFASAVLRGAIDLAALPALADEEIIARLTALRGIGSWTAKMYLIFVLRREDVLPFEDGAFMRAFRWLSGMKKPCRETVIKRCGKWRPYSSIAARYLYRALDTGLAREPFERRFALSDRGRKRGA